MSDSDQVLRRALERRLARVRHDLSDAKWHADYFRELTVELGKLEEELSARLNGAQSSLPLGKRTGRDDE